MRLTASTTKYQYRYTREIVPKGARGFALARLGFAYYDYAKNFPPPHLKGEYKRCILITDKERGQLTSPRTETQNMLEIQNVYEEHFTQEEVKKTLEDCTQVNWFAFILHNQDKRVNEQGEETNEVKKAHYHIIIDFTANTHKTIASEALKVLKPLFKDQDIRVKKVLNKVSFTRYLTHKDNPLKFQYSDNEVITSDIEVYKQLIEKQEDKATEVETMLEKLVYWCLNDKLGFVTERDLATYCMNNHCLKWYVQNIGRVSKMLGQMGVLVTGSTTYEIDN